MREQETVWINYDEILQDTGEGGATLFQMDDEEVWVPNSLITDFDEDVYSVEIPVWFAEKEGLV